MNILEQQDFSTRELNQIKQAYLQKQNLWMSKEIDFVNELIHHYKRIIQIQGEPESQNQIEKINEEIRNLVQKKKKEYKELTEAENEEMQPDITEDEFNIMIGSYQQKVGGLQEAIRIRQTQLQTIEEGKNKEGGAFSLKRYEPKLVNSIEIHGKLLERIRKGNKKLKQQKTQLENELLFLKSGLKSEESTLPSRQITGRTDRYNSSSFEEMSTFEKAVLILKKKRYSNDMLEERITQLTKKIAEKRSINKSLEQQISKLEWSCIENMQVAQNGFVESNCSGDMSVWEKSVQDNVSFSVDVSRFIKLMPRS